MQSSWGELVVELREDVLVVRPARSRTGGKAEVHVRIGSVYQRAIEQKLAEDRKARRKKSRRGT